MLRSKPSGANPASNSGGPVTIAQRQKAAREIGLRTKQLQESAQSALPQRKLYILLYIRSDPPISNDFHWGFYYHKSAAGGTKYHMRNLGAGWIAEHGSNGGVFKSQLLCVLVEIGSIPSDKEGTLDQIMRSVDGSANTIPGLTCRVWVFTILPLLIQAGLLRCNDLAGLQQECFNYGNSEMTSAASNEQPRSVSISSRCT